MEFFAISNGIPVHISDTKEGDLTILLLHGYLQTLNVWEEYRSLLDKCFSSIGYRSPRYISIDLPGHGLTGTDPSCNSMDFCADVVKGVLDICGVSSCILIGHSLGGFIAQKCLQKYPSYFPLSFLLNTVTFDDTVSEKSKRLKEISFIEKGMFLELVSLVVPNMFAKCHLVDCKKHIEEIIADCETHDINGIIASIKGMLQREDMTDFMKSTDSNFYFLTTTDDYYYPASVYTRMMNRLKEDNKTGHFKILCDCGHTGFLEYPEAASYIVFENIVRDYFHQDPDKLYIEHVTNKD